MSNNQQPPPYNPYMFPFPFHYPPPPFMNPMMPFHPKMPQMPANGQHNPPPLPPMHMPPFGFPHFPMMYPPPNDPFYPFPQARMFQRDPYSLNFANQNKIAPLGAVEGNKKLTENIKQAEQKESRLIILSDDQSKQNGLKKAQCKKPTPMFSDPNIEREELMKANLRRTGRKIVPPVKLELPSRKTRQIVKKQEEGIFEKKIKTSKQEEKEVKVTLPSTTETPHESHHRHPRQRFLTAKDGRGKIMIGHEFQANIPQFLSKNEEYTTWSEDKRSCILSRFFK